jgi:hypothetical protein
MQNMHISRLLARNAQTSLDIWRHSSRCRSRRHYHHPIIINNTSTTTPIKPNRLPTGRRRTRPLNVDLPAHFNRDLPNHRHIRKTNSNALLSRSFLQFVSMLGMRRRFSELDVRSHGKK